MHTMPACPLVPWQGSAHAGAKRPAPLPLEATAAGAGAALVPPKFEVSLSAMRAFAATVNWAWESYCARAANC